MRGLAEFVERGGWVMPVILTLSFIMFSRCFALLLTLVLMLRESRRSAAELASQPALLRRMETEALESFRRQRNMLGAIIAAAPLLGLLGTVSGMEKTFIGLSSRAGEKSMEALAGGISEVLVATESGLAVALPAMLLVYLAHRTVHRHVEMLNSIARGASPGGAL
jgi:biopolymer transport protein ExbB/TolQ